MTSNVKQHSLKVDKVSIMNRENYNKAGMFGQCSKTTGVCVKRGLLELCYMLPTVLI